MMAAKKPTKPVVTPAVPDAKFKVFIGWSGARSNKIASAVHIWLQSIFQDVDPWMSNNDIHAGDRWRQELTVGLSSISFGIFCLTPENLLKPWVLYETGAISNTLDGSKVVPLRFECKGTDLSEPLSQFQHVEADEEGFSSIAQSINRFYPSKLTDAKLGRSLKAYWQELDDSLRAIKPDVGPAPEGRNEKDMTEEMLGILRSLQKNVVLGSGQMKNMSDEGSQAKPIAIPEDDAPLGWYRFFIGQTEVYQSKELMRRSSADLVALYAVTVGNPAQSRLSRMPHERLLQSIKTEILRRAPTSSFLAAFARANGIVELKKGKLV